MAETRTYREEKRCAAVGITTLAHEERQPNEYCNQKQRIIVVCFSMAEKYSLIF
jgi:hypothetical protein